MKSGLSNVINFTFSFCSRNQKIELRMDNIHVEKSFCSEFTDYITYVGNVINKGDQGLGSGEISGN